MSVNGNGAGFWNIVLSVNFSCARFFLLFIHDDLTVLNLEKTSLSYI